MKGPQDFAPFKRRGQNFLVDSGIARRMVEALEPTPLDHVLEVGPGTGALTGILANRVARMVAVEMDRGLVAYLRDHLEAAPGFELVEADFLKVDPARLELKDGTKFLGNLPYSITTPILLRLVDWPVEFERVVITVQKEVADRIRARPGNRTYGRLTVMVGLFGTVRRLFNIPPGAFRPRPRVMSTVLEIRPHASRLGTYRRSFLEEVITAAFSSRRKRLANTLSHGLTLPRDAVEAVLSDLGHERGTRAEVLEPGAFVELSERLAPLREGEIS